MQAQAQQKKPSLVEIGGYALGYGLGLTLVGTTKAALWALKNTISFSCKAGKSCGALVAKRKSAGEPDVRELPDDMLDLSVEFRRDETLDDGGKLVVFFYPNAGIARRRVYRDGKRTKLADVSYTDAAAVMEQARQDAKPGATPVLVARNSEVVGHNENQHVESPDEQPAKAESVEIPPVTAQVSYRGQLVKCGIESHTRGNESYKCYTIHLLDTLLGGVNQLKGSDLERAVKEAGVVEGDKIEVALVGEVPVMARGKSTMKKVWSIVKLN